MSQVVKTQSFSRTRQLSYFRIEKEGEVGRILYKCPQCQKILLLTGKKEINLHLETHERN
jgi:hypothetical protein